MKEISLQENKESFRFRSIQMIAIKDTGMSLDFIEFIYYLFKNDCRNLKTELPELVPNTETRKKIETIIDKIHPLALVTSRANPDFWWAHYGHHGDSYFYQSFMKKLGSSRFAFITIYSNELEQEDLDFFVNTLKGSANIIDFQMDISETVKEGKGLRGLAEVDGLMINAEIAKTIAGKSSMSAEILTQTINVIEANKSKRVLFTRLPKEFQEIAFPHLSDSEQWSLMSNFVHAPDKGLSALESLKTLNNDDILDYTAYIPNFTINNFLTLCRKEF